MLTFQDRLCEYGRIDACLIKLKKGLVESLRYVSESFIYNLYDWYYTFRFPCLDAQELNRRFGRFIRNATNSNYLTLGVLYVEGTLVRTRPSSRHNKSTKNGNRKYPRSPMAPTSFPPDDYQLPPLPDDYQLSPLSSISTPSSLGLSLLNSTSAPRTPHREGLCKSFSIHTYYFHLIL